MREPGESDASERDAEQLRERVLRRCRELGFAAAGVCDASPTRYAEELGAWLAAGKHGDMDFLAKTAATLVDPARELAGVRSVIMVADVYHPRGSEAVATGLEDVDGRPRGRIARYARGRDYHQFIKKRLHRLNDELRLEFPGEEFRTFVDTAPVLEREYAARAGLGWIGRHTLAINPALGSYILLGGTLTTMRLEPGARPITDHCGTCTRCIDACPTAAISERSVDATRCISYLTIERQGVIDESLQRAMGTWVYGCDVCQEVCPHNGPLPRGKPEILPHYAPKRDGFDLLGVLGWDEAARREAFQTTSMKRATLAMMKRNALIALTNAALQAPGEPWAPIARARIAELAASAAEDAMVRETAAVSLKRLADGRSATR